MNRPRSPTKSAVLWQVIIARFYRKIYHYFANSTQPVGRASCPTASMNMSSPKIGLHKISVLRLIYVQLFLTFLINGLWCLIP